MRLIICCVAMIMAAFVSAGEQHQQLQRISPDEGLSQGYVTKTIQDNEGLIWIATQMGLNIFDGYQAKEFTGPNNSFKQEHILTLELDPDGFIWVSTYSAGLFKIDPISHQTTAITAKKPAHLALLKQPMYSINISASGGLWLGANDTLIHYDYRQQTIVSTIKLELGSAYIRDILTINGQVYVATSQGLYVIDTATEQVNFIEHRPLADRGLYSENTKLLVQHSDETLLVGTVDGLYSVSLNGTVPPKLLLESLNIWDIEACGPHYFIATSQGLFKANQITFKLEPTLKFSDSKYQISDNNINDILADRSGNLWLASASQGVLIWSPKSQLFTNYTASDTNGLSHDNIWTIHQDQQGLLWIGTSNGLNKLDLASGKIVQYLKNTTDKNPYTQSYLLDIFAKNEQYLWLSTAVGLRLFNQQTGKVESIALAPSAQQVMNRADNSISYLGKDSFAIFNPAGHYIFDANSGELTTLTELDNQVDPAQSIELLEQLPGYQDTLLIASLGRLIIYDRIDHSVKTVYQDLKYNPQTGIYADSWALDTIRNILWLPVSSKGLVGLDFTTFEVKHRINSASGLLASDFVYNVKIDDNDTLWFSSQSGLYRLNLATLDLTQYEVSDGIAANEFNSNAVEQLASGQLAYGSTRGITIFEPKELIKSLQSTSPYQVHFTQISVMSAEHSVKQLNQAIEFEHDDVGLTFEFSTLSYIQQKKTRYDVKLTGQESLEYQGILANSITFPKLPPGRYQLGISAKNSTNGKVSPIKIIEFQVKYSPWLSPSAKFSYLLVLIALIWFISNRRRYQRKLLIKAHKKVLESQEQMSLALKGSDSFIWDYHLITNQLYQNRINDDLGYQIGKLPYTTYTEHTQLIHPDDLSRLRSSWFGFVKGDIESWDASYRMKAANGNWIWYHDVGRVASRDDNNYPTRLTGTYTNITKAKATEVKAQLFGEAFSQIKDWVLILDHNKKPISANKAFYDEFNDDDHNSSVTLSLLVKQIGYHKLRLYIKLLNSLTIDNSWHGEETLTTPTRGKHPVRISVNAIGDTAESPSKHVEYYVLIVSDITEQKIAESKLQQLANYDHLTQLPNRGLILTKIEQAISDSDQNNNNIALFFIDLDRFKQVNDSLGHAVGDKLLQRIAERLKANIKANDCVARQSGDEFIILINSYHQSADLECIAERINKKLAEPILIDQHQIHVSSSIGIAIYPKDACSAADLIRNADIAMFQAKKAGRNRAKFFTEQMNEDTRERHHLECKLKNAVNNSELTNYYQPILDPHDSQIVGFELLLRWPTTDGFISPAIFIPIAEEIGLITQITEIAIEQALIDIKQWRNTVPQPYLSINLSAIHILQPGLVSHLVKLLLKHNLPTSVLRLEITESILMEDKTKALACLTELNDIGFDLFLDDFGTGYSSLTYIKQFPIKAIKIDQSFVRDIGKDSINESIIKTIISLADNLNIYCIAEGVETQEQLTFLRNNGCERVQGYIFSKPVPFEQTLYLLSKEPVASPY